MSVNKNMMLNANTMPTVKQLYSYLSEQIPSSLTSEWDNDGLMICHDSDTVVKNVLLTLDVTSGALKRAAELGCCVVISHHPLLFHPLKSITDAGAVSSRAIYALQNNITVMSFHTRLDAQKGGVNDVLASLLDLYDTNNFGPVGEENTGRIGMLKNAMTLHEFSFIVKDKLGSPAVLVTGDLKMEVRHIALVGGDGKSFFPAAVDAGADVFVTGRASFDVTVDAPESNIAVIEAGHYYTEAPVLRAVGNMISKIYPGIIIEYYNSNPSVLL